MTRLWAILGLFLVFNGIALADEFKPSSRIAHVTIFSGPARVTRQAQLDLPIGNHTIIFDHIVSQIDENITTRRIMP